MSHQNNRQLLEDRGKNHGLTALVKGFNTLCQSLSVLVLFITLFIGFNLSFIQNAQAETIITNTATANFSINGTAYTLSDSAQFTKDAVTLIPMTLLKQANKNTAQIGDVIDYTLTINNPNNSVLNNITIQDTLPAGLVYKVASATLNGTNLNTSQVTNNGNLLSFSIGNIPASTTWSLNYQLNVTQTAPTGLAINQAIANATEINSNSSQANVNIIESTPVVPLILDKTSNKTSVKVGDTIHYTLNIENKNSYTLNNIRVQDTLPTGLEYKFGSTTLNRNGSVDNSGNNNLSVDTSNGLIFSLGNIPASAKWTLGYDVIVNNTATSNSLTNLAQVVSDNSAANSANSEATVELISENIIVNKQANKITANIDDEVTYTVTIENPNQRALTNLLIEDTLPTGFVYKSASAKVDGQSLSQAVQINGRTLQFSIATLAKRKTITLSYVVSIKQNAITGNAAINTVQVSSDQALSAVATATVKVRTPSIIDFLIIDEAGTEAVIPPTSYNDNQNGGRHWQEINSIVLADGSRIDLPTPLPVSEAQQYTVSDPIIIQVTDLDQNLDPTKLETIIVTVSIPGTNDTEVLLLTETSPDSGIFRGVILTTTEPTQVQNGLLTLADGVKINVNYRDEEDSSDSSRTAALVVPDTKLPLTKTADKYNAAIGELVRYTLTFDNTTRVNLPNVKLVDTLPLGFRYLAGSAKLNGTALTNEINANGRTLNFNLKNMPSNSHWSLEYVTKISAGVQTGKAINTAQITTGSIRSNTARATVYIRDELMRDKNILTGRVFIGCRKDKANNRNKKYNPKVLPNARVYMETGRSVLSDEEGFWHMEGVQAGSHVLQLDVDSLPVGYEPLLCRDNTRHAGDAKSKFVDLQPGSLWQVDFYVKENPALIKQQKSISEKTQKTIKPFKLFGNRYLKSATPEFEILWPKNNYVPAVASTKIMVKSAPQHKVEVFLNGKKVNPLNYDGSDTNKARTVTIRRWTGVDIDVSQKDNELLVILKDKSGKEISRKIHNIHFSSSPASAELLADQSVLVADGKTTPIIALLIKDEDGFPMRANTQGYYILENSNYQPKTLDEDKDKLNLNENIRGTYKYLIEEGGIARIKLNPTTQSGKLRLKLKFTDQNSNRITKNPSSRRTIKKDRYKNIIVWLKPHLRKWIMVGIAEGTLGYQTLSGNMQTLKDLDQEDGFYKRGRIAFFAKGRVKGKYLLTVAYDTHKRKQEVGSQLNGNIDPDAWYTVYADNSNSQYDAPSSRKLFLKLEKDNFYALFGDFHAGLSVTELASYERVLNGIKTEYKTTHNDKQYSVNAFISETSNQHQHLEFPGDGTSGLYHLSRGIVQNSEKVTIETRDRFHSDRIIETRHLVRYQDYEIDYDAGTLFFKFPVTGRDENFNPNIIVVDYDNEDPDSNKAITAGGRVSVKTKDNRLEVGLSALNEGRNKGKDDRLVAADATYYITPDTKLHAEIASSRTQASNFKSKQAYVIELQKEIDNMEARLYLKKRDENFGISSQASEDGSLKAGAEVRYKLNNKTDINAEVSHQENSANDNQRQLAQVGVEHRINEQIAVNAGVRHSREEITDKSISNNTILLGGKYTTKDGKVTLRSNIEKNISSNDGSEISPDRAVVGVDVNLKNGFTVFAEHETTDNGKETTHNNRVGVTKDLWKGANAKSTYTQERTYQGQRDYATLGLSQKIKVTDKISADFSIDHAKTINDDRDLSIQNDRFNANEPSLQGTQRDDYTAFSVGLGANDEDWSWTTRFELRNGEVNDKINFQAGVIRHLKDGKNLSAKLSFRNSENNSGDYENHTRLSLGSAWHPKNKHFVFLNRLDLVDEDNSYSDSLANNYGFNNLNSLNNNSNTNNLSGLESHTQKVIHNMHYNRKINDKTQISIHHGIKHVKENNKGDSHSTTIDTATVEVRRDINKKWDVGVHGGYLHDWGEEKVEALAGVSVGVTPMDNAWLSLGYNFEGFYDKDFDKSDHKRQGAYMNFRYKFNQDSFDGDLPIRRKSKNKTNKDPN